MGLKEKRKKNKEMECKMTNEFGISDKKTPADYLQESVDTFKQRNMLYGDNYKLFGKIMHVAGNGDDKWKINSVSDWNRLGIIVQIVSKLGRYFENFNKGGHDDSLKDIAVYASMLRELDAEINDIPF